MSNQRSPITPIAPDMRQALVRSKAIVAHALVWMVYWYTTFGLIYFLVYGLGTELGFLRLAAGWHSALELVLRVIFGLLLAIWFLLIVRPVRMRRWLSAHLLTGLHWIIRRVTRRNLSAPSARSELAGEPDPALAATQRDPAPLSRRRFLAESILIGSVLGDGMLIEPQLVEVVEATLPIVNLPDRFVGLRIAQMSDLHINGYTTAHDLERAVEIINGLHPDLVMLTGDFVDWDARFARDATWPFRNLQAPEGVYSVIGNHDYYTGRIDQIKAAIQRAGLGLLVNDYTTIRRGADTLTLIGLDDPRHNRGTARQRMSWESITPGMALLDRLRPAGPRLVLLHNPILVPELIRKYELDLVVCGHTHGGQFQVPILTNTLIESAGYFVKGRYDLGRSQLYINRGFGFTGPPIRFGSRPEISLLRLVRAETPAGAS